MRDVLPFRGELANRTERNILIFHICNLSGSLLNETQKVSGKKIFFRDQVHIEA